MHWPALPDPYRMRAQGAVAAANVSVELRPGWNSVALQGPLVTELAVTGNVPGFATWDGTAYRTANFTLGEVNGGEGGRRGLWVFSPQASSFQYRVSGDTQGRRLSLREGWNLASFADAGPVGNLTAQADGQAVALNSVVLTSFTRLNADHSSTTVDATSGTLDSTRPYWIYAARPVLLGWTSQEPAPSPTPEPSPLSSPLFIPGGPAPTPTPVPSPVGTLRFASFPVTTSVTGLPADQPVTTFRVEVVGPNGQVVDANPQVTLSLEARPLGGNLTGPTVQSATAGVATFAGLGLDMVGAYRFRATGPNLLDGLSPTLWIRAGAAASLGFSSAPAVGTVDRPLVPLTVQLQDSKGNLVQPGATVYNVTLAGAPLAGTFEAILPANGELSFADARISAAGSYRLAAGTTGGVTNATAAGNVVIEAEASTVGPPATTPASLAFGPPPAPGTAGAAFPLTVRVLNGNGVPLTTAGGNVQLDVSGGTPATGARNEDPTRIAPASTVLTAPVVNGVATFSANLLRAGNWSLRGVWSQGLTPATQSVQIAAAATASLSFSTQPATVGVANATVQGNTGPNPVAPTLAVELLDPFGNRNLADARAVQLAFTSPGTALQGTTQVLASAGLATFAGVAYPPRRLGLQTLTATVGSLTGLSAPFDMATEAASTLANGELGPRQVNAAGPHIVSGDGRYVVYSRTIQGAGAHVWRKDRETGEELQIDVGSPDARFSEVPAISPNGQYVVFRSNYGFGGLTPPTSQIWCWHNGTVSLVSHVNGTASGYCNLDCVSADVNDSGLVVYDTRSDNILPIPHQGFEQVYATTVGNTSVRLVTESAPGVMMNTLFPQGCSPTVSADGTKVAFGAFASDLPGFNPGFAFAIYRRDLTRPANAGGMLLVSAQPNFPLLLACGGFCQGPVISGNGRYVAYFFQAINQDIASDDYGKNQVYRRDCDGPPTAYLQVSDGVTLASSFGSGSIYPSISHDGRYVAFATTEGLRGLPRPFGNRCNAVRRDCNSTSLALLNRRPGGDGTWSLGTTNTWPSLAVNNPTLCAFGSGLDDLYNSFNAAVFMTYAP